MYPILYSGIVFDRRRLTILLQLPEITTTTFVRCYSNRAQHRTSSTITTTTTTAYTSSSSSKLGVYQRTLPTITKRLLFPAVTTTDTSAFSSSSYILPTRNIGRSTAAMHTSTPEELTIIEPSPPTLSIESRPSLPLRYYDFNTNNTNENSIIQQQQQPTLDLTELSKQIMELYEQKQYVYEISREIQNSIQQIRNHNIGTDQAHENIQQLLDKYSRLSLTKHETDGMNDDDDNNINVNANQSGSSGMVLSYDKATNRTPRIANLSHTVEDVIRTVSYQHFLQTGTVMAPPLYCTDEEYLSGAIMGLCGDLQQYGLGRATVRDIKSVQMAGTVVTACMEYLLSFDFRNGPLRRKYDGCKYSLKALETFLYELAVTSPDPPSSTTTAIAGDGTSTTMGDILPMKELLALKERIEFRDELRETLIKKCRDGQKLAKQCIFALHRNHTDHQTPQSLLQQCSTYLLNDLLPIVQEEPSLRYGSYASVVEEYVEAKLFHTWLHGRDPTTTIPTSDNTTKTTNRVSGIILVPQDFMRDEFLQLEPDEYIGGLCDLTGEIGRYAVQRGTVRDVLGIKQCLYSTTIIYSAIQGMDRISSSNQSSKKIDTVRNNVQKIERMLYEISLSEAAGHGRTIHTDAPIPPPATDDA